ncbi:Dps family protein [Propionibacterium cyclohexanicum]|nr:DNA starvation/stationary phase protection protein [Propionibacterium cyclohexanicum]
MSHETVSATETGAHSTSRQNSEKGFVASDKLIASLQKVLVDLIELSLQGKQAHWNVVGANFRDLHLQLDEIVEEAREHSDVIAERLRALHATADGRSTTVAATTSLPAYPEGEIDTHKTVALVTERIDDVVATVREVHDSVDEEDPTTADLLHTIIDELEKLSWMTSAEIRSAK